MNLIQTKSTEIETSFRNLIRLPNINIQITYDMLQEYFDNNNHQLNTILKCTTRMQSIVLNERVVKKTKSAQKFIRIIPGENKSANYKISKGNHKKRKKRRNLSDNSIQSEFNVSNSGISNISSDNQEPNKSCVSDNEVMNKSKLNFLRVMKGVTTNLINDILIKGKEIPIKLDDDVEQDLKSENTFIDVSVIKNNDNNLASYQVGGKVEKQEIRDMRNTIEFDQVNMKTENKLKKELSVTSTPKAFSNTFPKDSNLRKEKIENKSCGCEIF